MQRKGNQNQPDQRGQTFSDPAAQVFPRQHIDHLPGENGGKKPADGSDANAHQHKDQLLPIGLQIAEYAQEQRPGPPGGILLFLLGEKHAAAPWAAGTGHYLPSSGRKSRGRKERIHRRQTVQS